MVNTEQKELSKLEQANYNILNIVVNTEQLQNNYTFSDNYNILNIVVNTELRYTCSL